MALKISRRFLANVDEFALAFAKAWYKLLHRDMGPVSRFLGPWVAEPQLWQDPVPAVDHELVGDADVAALKAKVLQSGLATAQLVSTAWASAASFRSTDKRGGATGARIRLEPQRSWEVNRPEQLATVLETLESIQREFNEAGGAKISLADLIVLAGSAAVEKAARDAGVEVTVPFHPGRTDANQEQTDVESFAVLEPRADGFRNYLPAGQKLQPETLLVDRAYMLNLTAPEMTVLVGGLRALGNRSVPHRTRQQRRRRQARRADRPAGRAHQRLLRQPAFPWHPVDGVGVRGERVRDPRRGHRRGEVERHCGRSRFRFGLAAACPLRGLCQRGCRERFVVDFIAAWIKVMELDRFDLV